MNKGVIIGLCCGAAAVVVIGIFIAVFVFRRSPKAGYEPIGQ